MDLHEWWKNLQDMFKHPLVLAAGGSFVGLRSMPELSRSEKASAFISGMLVASALGPAAVEWFAIKNQSVAGGVIFLTGSVGLVVFGTLWAGIKQTQLAEWIRDWLPRRRSQGGE